MHELSSGTVVVHRMEVEDGDGGIDPYSGEDATMRARHFYVTATLTFATGVLVLVTFLLLVTACGMRTRQLLSEPDACSGCTMPTMCTVTTCPAETGGDDCHPVVGRCFCNSTRTCVSPLTEPAEDPVLVVVAIATSMTFVALVLTTLLGLLSCPQPFPTCVLGGRPPGWRRVPTG